MKNALHLLVTNSSAEEDRLFLPITEIFASRKASDTFLILSVIQTLESDAFAVKSAHLRKIV